MICNHRSLRVETFPRLLPCQSLYSPPLPQEQKRGKDGVSGEFKAHIITLDVKL
jgi:hypothetical protein